MKLTNLNCPQCNGFLKQERDMFFCSSCGAAFTVDYDENDVEYTQLVTEADRTRMMLQSDVNLLQTQYQLKEQYEQNADMRAAVKGQKEAVKKGLKMSFGYIAGILFFLVFGVGLTGFVLWKVSQSQKTVDENRANRYEILLKQVTTDERFLENAIAAGKVGKRSVLDKEEDVNTMAGITQGLTHLFADPEIEDVYLFRNDEDKRIKLYMVYKFAYQYNDSGEVIELYTLQVLDHIQLNENDKITADFRTDNHIQGDYPWYAFYEKDQLYRELLWADERDGKLTKLDIPNGEEGNV